MRIDLRDGLNSLHLLTGSTAKKHMLFNVVNLQDARLYVKKYMTLNVNRSLTFKARCNLIIFERKNPMCFTLLSESPSLYRYISVPSFYSNIGLTNPQVAAAILETENMSSKLTSQQLAHLICTLDGKSTQRACFKRFSFRLNPTDCIRMAYFSKTLKEIILKDVPASLTKADQTLIETFHNQITKKDSKHQNRLENSPLKEPHLSSGKRRLAGHQDEKKESTLTAEQIVQVSSQSKPALLETLRDKNLTAKLSKEQWITMLGYNAFEMRAIFKDIPKEVIKHFDDLVDLEGQKASRYKLYSDLIEIFIENIRILVRIFSDFPAQSMQFKSSILKSSHRVAESLSQSFKSFSEFQPKYIEIILNLLEEIKIEAHQKIFIDAIPINEIANLCYRSSEISKILFCEKRTLAVKLVKRLSKEQVDRICQAQPFIAERLLENSYSKERHMMPSKKTLVRYARAEKLSVKQLMDAKCSVEELTNICIQSPNATLEIFKNDEYKSLRDALTSSPDHIARLVERHPDIASLLGRKPSQVAPLLRQDGPQGESEVSMSRQSFFSQKDLIGKFSQHLNKGGVCRGLVLDYLRFRKKHKNKSYAAKIDRNVAGKPYLLSNFVARIVFFYSSTYQILGNPSYAEKVHSRKEKETCFNKIVTFVAKNKYTYLSVGNHAVGLVRENNGSITLFEPNKGEFNVSFSNNNMSDLKAMFFTLCKNHLFYNHKVRLNSCDKIDLQAPNALHKTAPTPNNTSTTLKPEAKHHTNKPDDATKPVGAEVLKKNLNLPAAGPPASAHPPTPSSSSAFSSSATSVSNLSSTSSKILATIFQPSTPNETNKTNPMTLQHP